MEFDHIDLLHMFLCFRGGERGHPKQSETGIGVSNITFCNANADWTDMGRNSSANSRGIPCRASKLEYRLLA
jgi:hypothetical protein